MEFELTFDDVRYRKALLNGECKPSGAIKPFMGIEPEAYYSFCQKYGSKGIVNLNLDDFKHRFTEKMFRRVTGAAGITLKYAAKFFPTYKFLLKEILKDEWLAFANWDKFHRDHIIHPPMCLYVGLSLLYGRDLSLKENREARTIKKIKFDGKTLLEHCLDNLYNLIFGNSNIGYLRDYLEKMEVPAVYLRDTPGSRMLWKWIFLDTFFLATLFHDIGYPWKFANDIQGKLLPYSPIKHYLQKDDKPGLKTSKRRNLSRLLKDYKKQLLFYPLNDYNFPNWKDEGFLDLLEETLRNTHGLSGGLSLIFQNSTMRKKSKKSRNQVINDFCIHWAAMAVMMHDMAEVYAELDNKKVVQKNQQLRLSPEKDPLSFALTLTDQIQDFARPDAVFKSETESISMVSFRARCNAVRLNFDQKTNVLKIIYIYKNPTDVIKARDKYLPGNQLLYFDGQKGYLNYKPLSPDLKIILYAKSLEN